MRTIGIAIRVLSRNSVNKKICNDYMKKHLQHPVFKIIAHEAEQLNAVAFVVGGYVRDIVLKRVSKDIDVVVLGSGIALAERVARKLGQNAHVTIFKNFGTALLKQNDLEIEFVGA